MTSNYIGMCHPIQYNPYVTDAHPRISSYKTRWLFLESIILFGGKKLIVKFGFIGMPLWCMF